MRRCVEAGAESLEGMQRLVQEVWSRRVVLAGHHAGSLAWSRLQHVGREPEWPTRLWEEDGRVLAWGWVQLPSILDLLVHPDRPDLFDPVLDWFETQAQGDEPFSTPLADDAQATDALEARGFVAFPDAPWFAHATRRLDHLPEPAVPPDYVLRLVEPRDLERRVAVQDCVVEAPDGSFASYALAWLDDANRVGELEPVGTDQRHARLGLARAVCLYALRQLRAAGAETALVIPRGDEAHPAPNCL